MSYRQRTNHQFFYQLVALLLSIIVVHLIYTAVIRPNADLLLAINAEAIAAGATVGPASERSLYIILKDFEQEACLILMCWALAIMALKAQQLRAESALLQRAEQGLAAFEQLDGDQQSRLLPRLLRSAQRQPPQLRDSTVETLCNQESDLLDSELSMVRYIAWAIPSIGFIGTVRGIGAALGQAHLAIEGDIAGVTASLGVAFNSTFVALLVSMLVMFCLHQLQLNQERLVHHCREACEQLLPAGGDPTARA